MDATIGIRNRVVPKQALTVDQATEAVLQRALRRLQRQSDILAWVAAHPTIFVIIGCMDGRAMFWPLVEALPGTVKFWPTIGGKFSPTWPPFVSALEKVSADAILANRPMVVILTYHRAHHENDKYGCLGFKCDVSAQQQYMSNLKQQLEKQFPGLFDVLIMEIETDRDRIELVGSSSHLSDLAQRDLDTLLESNRHHSGSIRRPARATDHNEIMAVRAEPELLEAFGSLNEALLLSDPLVPDETQVQAVKVAGGVLRNNCAYGRVVGKPIWFDLAPEGKPELALARHEASRHILQEHVSDLRIHMVAATMNPDTWATTVLKQS